MDNIFQSEKHDIDIKTRKLVFQKQIDLLYRSIQYSSIANLFASTVIFLSLNQNNESRFYLVTWYLIILAVTALRTIDYILYKRRDTENCIFNTWFARFNTGALLTGTTWGLLVWFAYSSENEHLAIIAVGVVGVTAAAAATISYKWETALLYLLPASFLFEIRLVLHQTQFAETIAIFGLVYFSFILTAARQFYINSSDNIRLQLETKAREKQFLKLKDVAEQANHAKTEFMSNMSHELRTPLNAILGFTQLIQYDTSLSNNHKKQISEIKMAGNHLLSLVNQILDLARIEGRKCDLHIKEVNTDPIISECISFIRTMADKQKVMIINDTHLTPYFMADDVALKQIILNLISNAVKYNRPSGTATISCCTSNRNCIRFNITDTGQGIDEQGLQEIFEPFNRLGAQDTGIEGTGIGLAITRDLITEMGGNIGIESTPGVGSTFWFELPGRLVERNDSESAEDIDDTILTVSPAVPTDGKILVVEDNITNQLLLQNQLSRLGYECEVADNGKIALGLLSDRSYILILTDCNMPVMNGYQLATAVREKDADIPIIGITADAFPESEERCLSAGMTGRITKPVELQTLKDMLDRTLIQASTKLVNAVG